MRRLKFSIREGKVSIEVFGVHDASCEDLIRIFQQELGTVEQEYAKEQEFFEIDGTQIQIVEGE